MAPCFCVDLLDGSDVVLPTFVYRTKTSYILQKAFAHALTDQGVNRRSLLKRTGTAGLLGSSILAGCLGSSNSADPDMLEFRWHTEDADELVDTTADTSSAGIVPIHTMMMTLLSGLMSKVVSASGHTHPERVVWIPTLTSR